MTSDAVDTLILRPLVAADNAVIARVIREVSAEFGLTADKGFTVADPNLDDLFTLYNAPRSAYWVVESEGRVIGGGGVGPLTGAEDDICELQKMYFLPEARGRGLAARLVRQVMTFARTHGYTRCYLETTANLTQAIALYQRLGFRQITEALGSTGHVDCEVRMLKDL